jgi:hypothetical protein
MADLSPAAQAVLDAAYTLPLKNGQPSIAAAVRALADQVVPESELPQRDNFSDGQVWQWAVDCHLHDADTRSKILAIAAELEGKQ